MATSPASGGGGRRGDESGGGSEGGRRRSGSGGGGSTRGAVAARRNRRRRSGRQALVGVADGGPADLAGVRARRYAVFHLPAAGAARGASRGREGARGAGAVGAGDGRSAYRRSLGAKLAEIDSLLAAIVVQPSGVVDACLRVELTKPWDEADFASRFPSGKAARARGDAACWLPAIGHGSCRRLRTTVRVGRLVSCPATLAADLIESAGRSAAACARSRSARRAQRRGSGGDASCWSQSSCSRAAIIWWKAKRRRCATPWRCSWGVMRRPWQLSAPLGRQFFRRAARGAGAQRVAAMAGDDDSVRGSLKRRDDDRRADPIARAGRTMAGRCSSGFPRCSRGWPRSARHGEVDKQAVCGRTCRRRGAQFADGRRAVAHAAGAAARPLPAARRRAIRQPGCRRAVGEVTTLTFPKESLQRALELLAAGHRRGDRDRRQRVAGRRA